MERTITLLTVQGRGGAGIHYDNAKLSVDILNHCSKVFSFDKIILVSAEKPDKELKNIDFVKIDPISGVDEYNKFFADNLNSFFDTDFVMTVQCDGFIINPEKWTDEFFKYDYIGAPWQASSRFKDNRVGNGGFSLRSKKFTEYQSKLDHKVGHPEDLYSTVINHSKAIEAGIKFPSVEIAANFSMESDIGEKKIDFTSFGFHGVLQRLPHQDRRKCIVDKIRS